MKNIRIVSSLLAGGLIATSASATTSFSSDDLQFFRPNNRDGINVFESFWMPAPEFNGLVVSVGGHFTQQLQNLDHENTAIPDPDGDGVAQNELQDIGFGFNLATANLNLDVQLDDGVRMKLITYLSSRHHSETWVKDGYVQIDRTTYLNTPWLDDLMDNISVRLGHMQINYGDMQFRRTDNANAMYNPFVGNLIMDAFATEIGGEVTVYTKPYFAMIGVTGGEIRGGVTNPDDRAPAFIGKIGYDQQVNDDLRVRLTASTYHTDSSRSNTLYGGDRAGSRYYDVMDGGDFSGRFNPGFRDKITAFVINPFVKFGGLELFGNFETADGRAPNETGNRRAYQYAGEVLYRFLENEKVYVGGRYNVVDAELPSGDDINIDRIQIGGGWFINDYMLLKAEYVVQNYDDFPDTSIFNGGKFDGFMVEATIGF